MYLHVSRCFVVEMQTNICVEISIFLFRVRTFVDWLYRHGRLSTGRVEGSCRCSWRFSVSDGSPVGL